MEAGELFGVRVLRNVLIPLSDGVSLAGDLFLPDTPDPVPALVSYYPYHKDDLIGALFDHPNRYFAARGYASLLVDLRGLGNSEGVAWDVGGKSVVKATFGLYNYMLGDTYTIVDMNVWGWARLIPNALGEGAWEKLPNLKRLVDEISARPAAQRAVALKDRHKFKTEMDAEAMQAMFPHLNVKAA